MQPFRPFGRTLLTIIVLLPLCFIIDLPAILQHNLLATGPYLPPGERADTAVVLGYALRRDGTPTAPLRQRVVAGVQLFETDIVNHIIFSGGHPGGGIRGRSEAEAMEAYAELISQRSPQSRWYKEEQSTSTRMNALFSIDIIKRKQWGSLVVVTSAFHQLRSRLTFQCALRQAFPGVEPPKLWLAPVKDSRAESYKLLYDPFIKQANFFRELLAIAWYWYQGWLC